MRSGGQIRGGDNSCFFNIPPKQFSLLASILGLLLIDGLSADEQNSLGNFLVSMGQSILTSAGQEQLISSNDDQDDDLSEQLDLLKKQICLLENQMKNK